MWFCQLPYFVWVLWDFFLILGNWSNQAVTVDVGLTNYDSRISHNWIFRTSTNDVIHIPCFRWSQDPLLPTEGRWQWISEFGCGSEWLANLKHLWSELILLHPGPVRSFGAFMTGMVIFLLAGGLGVLATFSGYACYLPRPAVIGSGIRHRRPRFFKVELWLHCQSRTKVRRSWYDLVVLLIWDLNRHTSLRWEVRLRLLSNIIINRRHNTLDLIFGYWTSNSTQLKSLVLRKCLCESLFRFWWKKPFQDLRRSNLRIGLGSTFTRINQWWRSFTINICSICWRFLINLQIFHWSQLMIIIFKVVRLWVYDWDMGSFGSFVGLFIYGYIYNLVVFFCVFFWIFLFRFLPFINRHYLHGWEIEILIDLWINI